MLAAGAAVGLLAGLLAQPFVTQLHLHDGEIEGLVRLALLLPAGIFVAWWLLVPGMSLRADEPDVDVEAQDTVDPESRLQQIEATFDSTAVPSADRHRITRPSPTVRAELRDSVRRPQAAPGAGGRFGVGRPREARGLGADRAAEH